MKGVRAAQRVWLIETCSDYMARPRVWRTMRAGPFRSQRAAMDSAAWFRFLDAGEVSACRAVAFVRAARPKRRRKRPKQS